jgi:hypothetical protein
VCELTVRQGVLIQIFLPLYGAEGRRIATRTFERTAAQLVRDFGGLTAYKRSPAQGLWRKGGRTERDDIVVYEVMADRLARRGWQSRRRALEREYRQKSIVIRALAFEQV